MIQYIGTTLEFIYIILQFFLFTYLFEPLYKKCNVQRKIKKGDKTKIICKPKSILAFIYFIQLCLLFRLFTFKVISFLFIACTFGFLIVYDKFSQDLNEKFDKFNRMPIVILMWKLFHSVFTLIFICTNPVNKIFNSFVNKKYVEIKKIFSVLANLDSNSFADKNIEEINKQLGLKNDDELSKMSGISQYLVNSTKSEKKSEKKSNKKPTKIEILKTIDESELSHESIDFNKRNLDGTKSTNTESTNMELTNIESTNIESTDELNSEKQKYISLNNDINDLIEKLTENDSKSRISSSSTYKDELVEKLNNINNIFNKDIITEIEDITITTTNNN